MAPGAGYRSSFPPRGWFLRVQCQQDRRPLLQARRRVDYQCQRWYHTSMDKTTIYLPADLKLAIKRAARRRGVSEAEVVRESIRTAIGGERPHPRGGLFASGAPIASQDEEHLTGFGER